jgi:hypothetical protein
LLRAVVLEVQIKAEEVELVVTELHFLVEQN